MSDVRYTVPAYENERARLTLRVTPWAEWGPPGSSFIAPATMEPYQRARYVSLCSSSAGGEIRGYVQTESGELHLHGPCHGGRWPQMDARVAAVLDARMVPYSLLPGGMPQPVASAGEAA